MVSIIVAIFTAVLSAAVSISVCLISNNGQNKRHNADLKAAEENRLDDLKAEYGNGLLELKTGMTASMQQIIGTCNGLAHSLDLTNMRIQNLSDKVDKHNGVIERTYKLEERMTAVETRQSMTT